MDIYIWPAVLSCLVSMLVADAGFSERWFATIIATRCGLFQMTHFRDAEFCYSTILSSSPPLGQHCVAGHSIDLLHNTQRPRFSRRCSQHGTSYASDHGLTIAAYIPPTTRNFLKFPHFDGFIDKTSVWTELTVKCPCNVAKCLASL